MVTKGWSLRRLFWWMALASNSFPVPSLRGSARWSSWSDPGGHLQHLEQSLGSSDNALKSILWSRLTRSAADFFQQMLVLHGAVHYQHQFFVVDGVVM